MLACSDKKDSEVEHNISVEHMNSNNIPQNNIEKYTADYIAIRQLIDSYNDLVNHRTWDNIGQIFSREAVWEALDPINLKWSGLAEIKVKLPASVGRMEVLVQSTSGIVINVTDNSHASARSLLNEFGRNKETSQGMHAVGSYEDVLIKEGGNWKFLSRKLTLIYNDTLPVPGILKDYKY